jgi:hypothetical protein
MNEKITSYEALMEEQQRLKDKLNAQKLLIKEDLVELKQELRPVINVMSFLGKLAIPNVTHNSAVKAGAGMTIEWILKKVLSSNPLLRLIVPGLVKNYTSHYIGKAAPFIQKIKDKILSKKVSAIPE